MLQSLIRWSAHLLKGQALCLVVISAALNSAVADPMQAGRQIFSTDATPPCALCHSLRDAGAQGSVGPDLDALQPDAARVATALRNGSGTMPSYRTSLRPAQIEALALYVSAAARSRQ